MTRPLSGHRLVAAGALVAALFASACRSAEGSGLPPASGSGAAPEAVIPKLEQVVSPEATPMATRTAAWTGTLKARREAELGPKMSGVLSEITVEEGDKVKKGQLLFRLDAAQAALSVNQAKTALASAEVARDAAQLDFNRAAELIKGGSIAPAVFDQAKSALDGAKSHVEQAKAAVNLAQRGAFDTGVYSPIDGVVTAKLKSTGETVTMVPATTVLVVQDVQKLELRARLPESALAKVEEGTELEMVASAIGLKRRVTVKRVNPAIDPRTRTVEVVADVDNSDGKLKVGMLTEVGLASAAPREDLAANAKDLAANAKDLAADAKKTAPGAETKTP
jgi:RND family efflux transporter MFP subunit